MNVMFFARGCAVKPFQLCKRFRNGICGKMAIELNEAILQADSKRGYLIFEHNAEFGSSILGRWFMKRRDE